VLSLSRIIGFFKSIKERKTNYLDDPIKSEFGCEAEKQDLIWKAFGVDYTREIRQLEEARERFLLQLKTNLITDDVKSLIEDIVRDEVKRFLKKRGRTWRNTIKI
jgi:hypothetical protein